MVGGGRSQGHNRFEKSTVLLRYVPYRFSAILNNSRTLFCVSAGG